MCQCTSNARQPKAQYPFWYLRTDGFWEVPDTTGLNVRKGKPEPTVASLRANSTRGGFKLEIRKLLQADPSLIPQATEVVLRRSFPPTLWEDILEAVGLDVSVTVTRTKRDAKFREEVLRAYGYTCAICGFDGRVDGRLAAIEAAHIQWVEANGPNVVSNGIAMCSLHHKLFDLGGFTIAPMTHAVIVSNLLSGNSVAVRQLFDRNDNKILVPPRRDLYPATSSLRWHRAQVFKNA